LSCVDYFITEVTRTDRIYGDAHGSHAHGDLDGDGSGRANREVPWSANRG
jgi:hypothetical protein